MAVKIIRYSIPRMVDASNTSELILDCEYVYDANDLMLVVKWFHNNSPEPVYQWIPDRDVRYVGELLKWRIDWNYSVNPNDVFSKFRALRLRNNITVDLNGNFSCIVSSLAGQDIRMGQMVVYSKCTLLRIALIETVNIIPKTSIDVLSYFIAFLIVLSIVSQLQSEICLITRISLRVSISVTSYVYLL